MIQKAKKCKFVLKKCKKKRNPVNPNFIKNAKKIKNANSMPKKPNPNINFCNALAIRLKFWHC